METAKDTFYRGLQNDYRLRGAESVIYRFIQEEQERLYQQFRSSAEKGRKGSNLIQFRLHMDALAAGEEAPLECIVGLLNILSRRPVLYQDRNNTDAPALLASLAAAGLNERTADISPKAPASVSKRRLQEDLKELARRLEQRDPTVCQNLAKTAYAKAPCQALLEISDAVMESAAHAEVKAFFYDAGYPLSESRRGNIQEPAGNPKPPRRVRTTEQTDAGRRPKVDKTLNLLDAYCRQSGFSLFQSAAEASLEDCQKLFALLAQGDNKDVLIPLRVDSRTGCALYIVGKNHYTNVYAGLDNRKITQEYKDSASACSYGILRLMADSSDPEFPMGYALDSRFDEYASLEEAMAEYDMECGDALLEIREHNQMLPAGSPEVFQTYGRAAIPDASAEELAEAALEEQAEYEIYQKRMLLS